MQRSMADHPVASPARPLRVLAVDDSPANLMVLASFLRLCRVDVRTVDDGADALSAFQAFTPDLVFMDLSMPGIDGFEAAASIRTYEIAHGLVRTPIVALSAFEIDDALGPRLARSMDDHLSKPVRKQDVVRMLQRWAGLPLPEPT
jgi:CheY-like chemotaxis protein